MRRLQAKVWELTEGQESLRQELHLVRLGVRGPCQRADDGDHHGGCAPDPAPTAREGPGDHGRGLSPPPPPAQARTVDVVRGGPHGLDAHERRHEPAPPHPQAAPPGHPGRAASVPAPPGGQEFDADQDVMARLTNQMASTYASLRASLPSMRGSLRRPRLSCV
ncbi:unnamed protein product [Prorocentrum cordatum]|uniref:Uncharacterized protein n=1 Tax=Prorocentrum cordatum TaxID=2364126 RepID=A0ABN9W1S7_9DINO|nr:unnamed protein product [Polarella glacialis]